MRKPGRIVMWMLLVWLAAGVALAQEETQERANVSWVVAGCWLALQVHPEVNLGVASAEVFLTLGYLEDVTDNPIVIITTCADWALQASLTWAPPPDSPPEGDGLADFRWWVISGSGPGLLTYQGSPDVAGDGQVAEGKGPGEVTLLMGYRYDLDLNDVPGQYQVLILYTVTGR